MAASVDGIWRYPVKSLLGERLTTVVVERRGLEGDRRWALRTEDGKLGSGKAGRRFRRLPGLFEMAARSGAAAPVVTLPDGRAVAADDPGTAAELSRLVGEPVSVVEESEVPHFDDAPVHLMTTASLRWLAARLPGVGIDARRFRPNLVLAVDGDERVEDGWPGCRMRVGEVVLQVEKSTTRCVMTTLAQQELRFEPRILKELAKASDERLGVYASVVVPGVIRLGDPVALVPPDRPPG